MQTRQLLILADDLSGALDCALEASQNRYHARITIASPAAITTDPGTAIWALDTDTRRYRPGDAARRCAQIVNAHRRNGQRVYKKIDSLLRGNLTAEIACLVPMLGTAIIAPAYPDLQRTTSNGYQYLGGVGLPHTEAWLRETGSRNVDLPLDQLMRTCGLSAALVGTETIERGPGPLATSLTALMDADTQTIVCDAQTNTHLETVARACQHISQDYFLVGSAGLARYIPPLTHLEPSQEADPIHVNGPILIIVGSASSVSRAQTRLVAHTRPVTAIKVPADVLRTCNGHPLWAQYRQQLSQLLRVGQDVILSIADQRPPTDLSVDLAHALVELADLANMPLGGLICTGGETCHNLLVRNGYQQIRLLGQIEQGVPLSLILRDAPGSPIPLVTKAGAFGTMEALANSYDYLHAARKTHQSG